MKENETAEEDDDGSFVFEPSSFLADMVKTLEVQARAMPWMFNQKESDETGEFGKRAC